MDPKYVPLYDIPDSFTPFCVLEIKEEGEERLEKAKKPLESFNLLGRTLEDVAGMEGKSLKSPALPKRTTVESDVPALPIVHVSSSRGRKNTLYNSYFASMTEIPCRKKEMEQFKMVVGHSIFRKNPLGVLGQHLTNTVKMQQSSIAKQ